MFIKTFKYHLGINLSGVLTIVIVQNHWKFIRVPEYVNMNFQRNTVYIFMS